MLPLANLFRMKSKRHRFVTIPSYDEASSSIEGLVKLSLNSAIGTSRDVIEACPKL